MADGCPEKIDMEFLRYIWQFERKETPEIMQNLQKYGPHVPVFTLSSRKGAGLLLDCLQRRAAS